MSTDRQTDADALVGRTAEAARDSDVRIAVAESLTGGSLSASLAGARALPPGSAAASGPTRLR